MAILLGKSCKSLKRGDVHMALDSPLPLLAVFTCIGNLPIPCPLLCFFKDGCAVVTGSSSPPLGTAPDYHLRNLLSSNLSLCFQVMFPQPPPHIKQSIPPSLLVPGMGPRRHGIQAGLITGLLITSSGNTGEMLHSTHVAQEAAGSHLANSM